MQQHLAKIWTIWIAACVSKIDAWDSTSVTNDLNERMKESPTNPYAGGKQQPYYGGKGVFVRDLIDTLQVDPLVRVVPATFWSNDIYSISNMYPDVDMIPKKTDDVWKYASVGIVVGTMMPQMLYDYDNVQSDDWGWGVFYGRDSNSADIRCRWLEHPFYSYDCPGGWIDGKTGEWKPVADKRGAGGYPAGNPYLAPNGSIWGGGAGCHFGRGGNLKDKIDQLNAIDSNNQNLVQNHDCECNYNFDQVWAYWIDNWVSNTKDKPEDSPSSFWGDRAICWVKNIRMMINMQNWLWWKWNNKEWTEKTSWPGKGSVREYIGWNEVPVDKGNIGNPAFWDAFVIKLPAYVCGTKNTDATDMPQCLENDAQIRLEDRIDQWVAKTYIVPGEDNAGNRPGSYTVFAQEYTVGDSGNWRRVFFCTNWNGPSKRYNVVSVPISPDNKYGECYLEKTPATSVALV